MIDNQPYEIEGYFKIIKEGVVTLKDEKDILRILKHKISMYEKIQSKNKVYKTDGFVSNNSKIEYSPVQKRRLKKDEFGIKADM